MHMRIRTEAPPPQEREHTDQPPHEAHSFMKCSWLCICVPSPPTSALLDDWNYINNKGHEGYSTTTEIAPCQQKENIPTSEICVHFVSQHSVWFKTCLLSSELN